MTVTLSEDDRAVRIVALFSVLIHAWQANDFHVAAMAKDELAECGVVVRIPRNQIPKEGDHAEQ